MAKSNRKSGSSPFDGSEKLADFRFWMSFEAIDPSEYMQKGSSREDGLPSSIEGEEPPMRIRGVVTTNRRDFQGEKVLPGAIDWSYFLKRGWFIDGHGKDTKIGVGYPTKVEPDVDLPDGSTGTVVEGVLYPTDRGRDIFKLAKAIKGTPRRLGFSVQGPILKRSADKRDVLKAVVMDVAIDRHPVNPGAYLEALSKSLSSLQKALSAGSPEPEYIGGGSGAGLIPQSLQGKENRTMGKKRKWEDFTEEEQNRLLKAMENQEDEEEEDEDELEKSLSSAMDDIRDSLEKGGSVFVLDAEDDKNFPELMKALSGSVSDLAASISDRMDVLAKALMANGKLTQDLVDRISDLEDTVDGEVGELNKSLSAGGRRRSVLAGDRVPRPGEESGDDDEIVLPSKAKDMLRKGFSGATDPGAKAMIGKAMLLADGGATFKRGDLKRILGS